MKRMKGEVVLNMAAQKAWEMYRDDGIMTRINPQMLSSAEYVQGDGSPGSLRHLKLGPAVTDYVKESTQRIERVETGHSVTYRVIGGDLRDMYDPYRVTFSFMSVEGKEGERCVAQWKAEFEPLDPSTPLPEKARDAALGFLKSFENFEFQSN